MGNFKIEIEAVGSHGSDRTALEGAPHTPTDGPDKLAQDFVREMQKANSVVSAKLTHWPDTTPIVDNLLTGIRDHGDFKSAWASEDMLKFFAFSHLPEGIMRETSRQFCHLAFLVVRSLPRSPERTVALRKLLEGKDAAVRAAMK